MLVVDTTVWVDYFNGRINSETDYLDCLIATFCIAENHTLLHRETDFDGFEKHLGLRVAHPV